MTDPCKATKRVKAEPDKGIGAQTVRCTRNAGHPPKDKPLHYGAAEKNDGTVEMVVWS